MATNPAGGSLYGDLSNTPGFVYETQRSDTTVNTPEASYTVAQLVALINAAVYAAGAVDADGFGKAESVEAS
jgi:hypothetical protein